MNKNSFQLPVFSCQLYAAVLFCLLMLAGCAKKEIKNIDSQGKNIICFGDSLTIGYGVLPGEDYPAQLGKLVEPGVINAGVDGDITSEALRRLDSDVLDRDPLLVIIEFGGNDFLRKTPIATTIENISRMIEHIHERGAMAAVVDISAGMLLREYRLALIKVAKEKGALFIPDVFKGIITNPNLKSDFLHPNSFGYNIIAQRIYRAILPYLDRNSLLRKPK